jgi:uncharacterized protein YciI
MTFKLRYFLILVDYVLPLQEVDAALDAHRAFLKSHYDAGHFLMSGARTPRDGGIILAQASDRDEVSRWLQDDPFCKAGVAEYQIKEWNITMSAPGWPVTN